MDSTERNLDSARRAMRLLYGLVPIVAGLDKFTNILADWETYLSPLVPGLLGVDPSVFMRAVGVVEILAGVLVLSPWSRLGAYVVSAWLVGIAANLASTGRFFDVAVRDLVMSAGAFTLARLLEWRAVHTPAPELALGRGTRVAARN